jgi:hypothetical protein
VRGFIKMADFKPEKIRIFKSIKPLDAEIRFISSDKDSSGDIYWTAEVGFCESMGERGYTYTFFYDNKPSESEIIKDSKEHIREQIQKFQSDGYLDAYEEQQLKALKKVRI